MHEFAVFNSQIIPAKNSSLDAISPAAFYGKGIFTTVAIYDSKPFLWAKHWQRIIENAEKIGIDLSMFQRNKVEQSLFEIISKNKIADGRARLTFFDESSIPIWQTIQRSQTNLLINTADFRKSAQGLRLSVSSFRINSTSPLRGVKSCNYLENTLALENAKKDGFDEALRINERGEIVSACMANVFWLKGETIFTTSLETGCLAGTTREFILEKYPVKEVNVDLDEVSSAEAVFLTSAGIGIVQVTEFQQKIFNSEIHGLTKIVPPKI